MTEEFVLRILKTLHEYFYDPPSSSWKTWKVFCDVQQMFAGDVFLLIFSQKILTSQNVLRDDHHWSSLQWQILSP
jgi:hypothetical protein